ncbi:MAG: ARMT1-like domain-containing protein [Sulfuricurvum sp.]|nr:ARMT1-like domain-containing protein [Sulfuricurvum sp.]MDD5385777.1 ARMT1-like domain-containing protein [Sulfuricurvum sp.]
MTIQNECIGCIISQSERVCDAIEADEALREKIVSFVETSLSNADFTLSPPVIAAPLYEQMALFANKVDLYDEQKKHATAQAQHYIPFLRETIEQSNNPFMALLKTAVVGNVIDLAAEVAFDLHGAISSVFDTPFAHDDSVKLAVLLQNAKTLLYIGDNTGEHLFDTLAIEHLKKLYPALEITYMVRGNFIINDVTMKEAYEANMDQVCTLMDSGVNTPGFVYERATQESQKLFDSADVIIAKGMGNYECMTPTPRKNICFLLKIKCSVVSHSLGHEIGSIICKID